MGSRQLFLMDKLQQYAEDWKRIWMKCGRNETAVFESNNIAYTNELITCEARKNLMVWIYYLLRNFKYIKPIEELDDDTKRQMWGFVNEVCAGKTNDPKRKKHIAMVFYAIEYFLNEKQ